MRSRSLSEKLVLPAAAGGRRWLSLVETIFLELTEK